MLQAQVAGENEMSGYVCERGERGSGNLGNRDSQSIQPVRQIHSVGEADDDQRSENKYINRPPDLRVKLLKKWNAQARVVVHQELEREHYPVCYQSLQRKLLPPGQSQVLTPLDFQVVVGKSDCAEGDRGRHREPYVADAGIRPQQSRDYHREYNENSAHRRRAPLGLMRFGAFLPYLLSDLE